MKKRIIYDGDPGIDDALAILLATQLSNTELLGVTTVAGNAPLPYTTRNALNVLEKIASRNDIPVAAGFAHPIIRKINFSPLIHGSDGLAETFLPDPETKPAALHALDQIIYQVKQNKGQITVVSAGPLTNLAIALLKEPDLKNDVKNVVIMGGCIRTPGNVTMAAEFNIYSDPEAAHIVFTSGLPITLVSLDLTTNGKNIFTRKLFSKIRWKKSAAATFVQRLLQFYIGTSMQNRGIDGCYLHDPLAMLLAIDPDLIKEDERIFVDVELHGDLTFGRTQADLRKNSEAIPNVRHILNLDFERALNTFLETLNN